VEKFCGTAEIARNGYQLWDVPSKTDLDLYFPGTDFLAERSEGDSRSESSPVRPVRQFWIKSLYATTNRLTVNRKIKIKLNRGNHGTVNGYLSRSATILDRKVR